MLTRNKRCVKYEHRLEIESRKFIKNSGGGTVQLVLPNGGNNERFGFMKTSHIGYHVSCLFNAETKKINISW